MLACGGLDLPSRAATHPHGIFRAAVELLTSIPGVGPLAASARSRRRPARGVGPLAARVIVAETGADTGRFPAAGHLVSRAGLCPRNDESAGKRRSDRLREGAPWLKATLVQCAWAASRKTASCLQAQYHRLRGRRGPREAIRAVAASILTAACHTLKDGTARADLGPHPFDRRSREMQARRLLRRLADLGYAVELAPLDPAPA